MLKNWRFITMVLVASNFILCPFDSAKEHLIFRGFAALKMAITLKEVFRSIFYLSVTSIRFIFKFIVYLPCVRMRYDIFLRSVVT